MKRIIANVRVRKQDGNGNTYHDVELIDVMSERIIDNRDEVYGYGEHYKQTAEEMIEANFKILAKRFPPIRRDSGAVLSTAQQLIDAGKLRIIYIVHQY